MAAATALLDRDWQHRAVGLVGDKAEETEHSLLSSIFYIDRALKPFAAIHIDALGPLLAQNMSVLVLTDATPLEQADIALLTGWIEKGGVFVRFAGEHLATAPEPRESALLPVILRTGDRAMGGTMSWATPQKLRAFPQSSPFNGLVIPPDIAVNRQILAEPADDLEQKTWADLEDGTPLVTAKKMGRGLSILFHVPARSEWSNLPLSGLFVEMLRQDHRSFGRPWHRGEFLVAGAPQQLLDAFGDEQTPGPAVESIADSDFSHIRVGPHHPPGTYGNAGFERALNLGDRLDQPELIKNIAAENYRLSRGETGLQPWLLLGAFILLLFDFLVSLKLRGILNFPGARRAGIAVLLFVWLALAFHPARAAHNDKAAIELTSKT